MPAVIGIAERGDVVDGVAADLAVARLVKGRVGRDALEADGADADVVVVVDEVAGDGEVFDIAVDRQGLAPAGLHMVDLVAADDEGVDGGGRPGAADRDAEGIRAALVRVGRRPRDDVVHMVVDELDMLLPAPCT